MIKGTGDMAGALDYFTKFGQVGEYYLCFCSIYLFTFFLLIVNLFIFYIFLGGHIGTKIYASWRTFWCFLNMLLLDVAEGHMMNLCVASHKIKCRQCER